MALMKATTGGRVTIETWIMIAAAAGGALLLSRVLGRGRASRDAVRDMLAKGAVVVDVRTPDEFRRGAYRGALNIPVHEIAACAARIPRDRPVVVYCASGMRSGVAAGHLRKLGYSDVVNAGSLRDVCASAPEPARR
jgi:rhodanese-related sulfurtransferase